LYSRNAQTYTCCAIVLTPLFPQCPSNIGSKLYQSFMPFSYNLSWDLKHLRANVSNFSTHFAQNTLPPYQSVRKAVDPISMLRLFFLSFFPWISMWRMGVWDSLNLVIKWCRATWKGEDVYCEGFKKFGSRFFLFYLALGSHTTKLDSTDINFWIATASLTVISDTNLSLLCNLLFSPVEFFLSTGRVWGAVKRIGPAEC